MGNALALVRRKNGFVPTFGFEPRGFIDRKTRVVADLDTLAMVDVFVSEVAPLAGQVDLRGSGCRTKAQTQKAQRRTALCFLIRPACYDKNGRTGSIRTSKGQVAR